MNDEIKARLIRYADQLESAAGKGADFLAEQAPETVRQFLAWHFWSACGLAVVFLVLASLLMWASRCAWIAAKEHNDDDERALACSMVFAVVAGACVFGAVVKAFAAAKIAIAPNVFILERLAEMVRT